MANARGSGAERIVVPGRITPARLAYRVFRLAGGACAVLRIDGIARGAFDAEHRTIVCAGALAGYVTLDVDAAEHASEAQFEATAQHAIVSTERRAFVRAIGEPAKRGTALLAFARDPAPGDDSESLALRTFASAVRQLELDAAFVYDEPRTSRYESVLARDPALFGRVANLARVGRFDASGAALWGARDRPFASGEAVLRALAFGVRFARRELGTTPVVAWFADAPAYPQTLPTLLAHAGIHAFVAPGLAIRDRFRWYGPDGAGIVAASLDTDGRDAVLVADGPAGISDRTLLRAMRSGTWTALGAWIARVRAPLPAVHASLASRARARARIAAYDGDAGIDALERDLVATETLLAWAYAMRATPFFLDEARGQLDRAWRVALGGARAGSPARRAEADALLRHVASSARSVLPTARLRVGDEPVAPAAVRGGFAFENGTLRAVVRHDGTLASLATPGGRSVLGGAGRLVFRDGGPPGAVRATGCELVDGGLEVRFAFGRSLAVVRYALDAREPFLRATYAVAWNGGRRAALRVAARLAFRPDRTRLGAPHGALDAYDAGAIGTRFVRFDGAHGGLAVLRLDPCAWSLPRGRVRSEFSCGLVRGPAEPNGPPDDEPREIALAYAPFAGLGMGELESMWARFASEPAVPMFVSSAPNVVVVATKLADDGAGVILRARECDGASAEVRFACGARVLGVACADALERETAGDAAIEDGELRARFTPFALRSFRVRLR